ncbi:DUF445 domain-containing protein [Pectinatus sottacetonis]|uniref:DUF445 domain-containing protein n=1 Tax=Pectinatus sottacetonis TaxID=1002795 RepID=UPI0018C5AE20|nr:DUF445 domain-containing protein [Pectinatus sottacetonis]
MEKLNRADKTLIIAACLFVMALALKVKYADNIFCQGFLFCIEAALVGGIADWFAVTALFKKPLGIPWHTAILPRRKEAFAEATVRLVQRQFFSRKNIFLRLKSFNIIDKIITCLDNDKLKKTMAGQLIKILQKRLYELDLTGLSEQYASIWEKNAGTEVSAVLRKSLTDCLRNEEYQQRFLGKIMQAARDKLKDKDTVKYIKNILQQLQQEKMSSGMSSFLLSLGNMFDVINNEECAQLIQQKILSLIEQISDSTSDINKDIRHIINNTVGNLLQQDIWEKNVTQLEKEILSREILTKLIFDWGTELKQECLAGKDNQLKDSIENFIVEQFDRCLYIMRNNSTIKNIVNKFISDIAGRSALQAQSMVGDIIRSTLKGMNDTQLNNMVYTKIETDLVWIRMNGSIVGSSIGLVIFLFMQIIK